MVIQDCCDMLMRCWLILTAAVNSNFMLVNPHLSKVRCSFWMVNILFLLHEQTLCLCLSIAISLRQFYTI